MKQKTQPLVVIFFLALLVTAYGLNKSNTVHAVNVPFDDKAHQKALARYGFAFEEVAQQVGVKFQHQAPVLDEKLAHIMPQIASMGAGVAVCDFDRDGWNDFYVTNSASGSMNALYLNKGDGTFEDVAEKMGVADLNREGSGTSMGAVWGDYDNDGFEDLLVYKWGHPELFHNNGGKGFTNATAKAGLPRWVNANNAIWFDYDRDGNLDIFIGGYYREDINLWDLKSTDIMPESFEYAQNGGRKYLLRGQGDGTFEDVTLKAGLISRRWALAAVAGDFRGTGYPDLVIANDYGVTEFFANDKGRFREIGRQVGIGFAPKSGMNANIGDVLNTGTPAIYISNITEPNILNQRNNLWVPREGTKGASLRYDNLADNMGIGDGGWSFGAVFSDFNNDGTKDLYCTNGYVSGDRQKSYWYDYSKITGANTAIIRDAKNWPPMGTNSLSGYQSKRVWINDGAASFREVAQNVGVKDKFDGRAVAVADLWNRGTLDIIVANQKGPLLIYKNSVQPDFNWVQLELRGAKSNRSAIGAQVTLYWDGKKQTQILSGGEGFCSQNMRRLHFGLGKDTQPEKAIVRWPSGAVQTVTNLKMNEINTITESATKTTGGRNAA
ncbi:MAG TPA: CRTAC1 family protein [Abditibacteriaceae bacterium]|jgi:hypothetical protein